MDHKSQPRSVAGFVAILDSLGSKLLSLDQAKKFVELRDSTIVGAATNGLQGFDLERFRALTFNDTVIFTYETGSPATLQEAERFCQLLRLAAGRSMAHGYPFRGAIAVGDYFVKGTNTVMGPAVSGVLNN